MFATILALAFIGFIGAVSFFMYQSMQKRGRYSRAHMFDKAYGPSMRSAHGTGYNPK